jgi:hypothetical protein
VAGGRLGHAGGSSRCPRVSSWTQQLVLGCRLCNSVDGAGGHCLGGHVDADGHFLVLQQFSLCFPDFTTFLEPF